MIFVRCTLVKSPRRHVSAPSATVAHAMELDGAARDRRAGEHPSHRMVADRALQREDRVDVPAQRRGVRLAALPFPAAVDVAIAHAGRTVLRSLCESHPGIKAGETPARTRADHDFDLL